MKTYLSISITYYASKKVSPEVHYYRHDGKSVTSTWDKLTVNEANRLMWELVKLGGVNHYKANSFNNAISTREVIFWGVL